MNKDRDDRWVIRHVSPETQKKVKLHAGFRDLTVAQMLDVIVSEWHEVNPFPADLS